MTTATMIRDRAGKLYRKDHRGVIQRVSPLRPWRGKSERRAVLKARRIARQESA